MDSPTTIRTTGKQPQMLSQCGSLRRRSISYSNSPEFEFWRVRNPSEPPTLLSADELFHDGVLLPLHLLDLKSFDPPDPDPQPPFPSSVSYDQPAPSRPETEPGPKFTHESATTGLTASKRWRDIFKKSETKSTTKNQEEREKENKKREKKNQTGSGSGSSAAELNINIWPFSRSRSAGNSVTRPRIPFIAPATTRKVRSAPCSRSNSAGESKSRKWPSSPGRAGVHLGRSSPIWQVRRGPSAVKSSEPAARGVEKVADGKKEITEMRRGKTVNKAKVLNLNVPMCIGYRSRLSCRSDESGSNNSESGNSNIDGCNSNVGTSGGNHLFGLRNLFTKKVY